ncbi:MAG: 2-C-methyl-D-erythritol 2,4-cyclodiphosphate synthase [Ureaplasma sp.]|nr:2-C-methyl-D-erythritol 2,4-cyclodiphosphate synthase [Ureaplasma sp.]
MIISFSKDIHKIKKRKNSVIKLANLSFNSNYQVIAHSDGDIILHAISDAILSGINQFDIGYYFKDNDSKNKNLNSLEILNKALELLNKTNYEINNIDLTIICNHIFIMDKRLEILDNLKSLLSIQNINIKGRRFELKNKTIECYCILSLKEK